MPHGSQTPQKPCSAARSYLLQMCFVAFVMEELSPPPATSGPFLSTSNIAHRLSTIQRERLSIVALSDGPDSGNRCAGIGGRERVPNVAVSRDFIHSIKVGSNARIGSKSILNKLLFPALDCAAPIAHNCTSLVSSSLIELSWVEHKHATSRNNSPSICCCQAKNSNSSVGTNSTIGSFRVVFNPPG